MQEIEKEVEDVKLSDNAANIITATYRVAIQY